MPVYEYECLQCRKTLEITKRDTMDQKVLECPSCGGALVNVTWRSAKVVFPEGWTRKGVT